MRRPRARRAFLPLLALLALGLAAAGPARAQQLVDGIAAQVGPDIVLVSDVMQMIYPMEQQMREAGAPEAEIAKLRAEGLERMIEWRLLSQVVARSDLQAGEEQVDRAMEAVAQEAGISREQLQREVEAHGMSFEDYRSQIRREMERRNVIQAMVAPRVDVEPEEVRARYQQEYASQPRGGTEVHLRQVLVAAGGPQGAQGRTKEWACASARAAHERVRSGERFAVVASEVSDVAGPRGGDLGWILQDTLAGWMAGVASSLEPGQMSDVVELPIGCTFLQLVDRREYRHLAFEDVRSELQQRIYDEKLEEEFRAFLERLRAQTYIDRKGYFADAASFGEPTFPVASGETEGPTVP